jgi:hypothetical protein
VGERGVEGDSGWAKEKKKSWMVVGEREEEREACCAGNKWWAFGKAWQSLSSDGSHCSERESSSERRSSTIWKIQ